MSVNISVVIPTLDERYSIPDCLSCLEGQTRDGDEVIVVDGGSTDGTIEIAKQMADKVFVAKTEHGQPSTIGASRHVGVMESSGEVVASTDADALPPDGWVDQIRSHFTKDEDLVVLWGNIQDKNGVPIRNLVGKFSTLFRGASGNNTAFRRSVYMEMDNTYDNTNFAEDGKLIHDMSAHGKAVRDRNMVMVMDMDRDRYQKKPILGFTAASIIAGRYVGGKAGNIITGAGVGMGATEVSFEGIANEIDQNEGEGHLHHDQVGIGLAGIGNLVSGSIGEMTTGLGAGVFAHHALTEGISSMPTTLNENTDAVIDWEGSDGSIG